MNISATHLEGSRGKWSHLEELKKKSLKISLLGIAKKNKLFLQ